MDGDTADVFRLASRFLVEAVQRVPASRWDGPGLGSWTLRELVGHANRAHTTVEEYLRQPQPPAAPGSSYFSEAAIAQRGREAVAALGPNPAVAVAAKSAEVIALIERTSPETPIGSPAGTMPLARYLPSRVTELTIHGIDIVRALGTDLEPPAQALQASLTFVVELSVRRGQGNDVLLALTGRGELAPTYSVF